MIDLFSRAALVVIFGCIATLKGTAIIFSFHSRISPLTIHSALELTSEFSSLAFAGLVIVLTATRLKPLRSASGWEPRVSAVLGTFLTFLLPLMPQIENGTTMKVISIIIILAGFALSVSTMCWLGRSLSVTAQARKLVTTGPYALVRHPLYLCEEIVVIGLILNHFCLAAIILGVMQGAFQWRRMQNEERVLRAAFHDYAVYVERTPRLIPRAILRPFVRPITLSRRLVSSRTVTSFN
jgi:protein-S-isoprenylcysteine O-methyltransferase Ste14